MVSRYFQNPYKDYTPSSHLTFDSHSCRKHIQDTLFTCMLKNKPSNTSYCAGGLYTGSLGILYTSFYLQTKNMCDQEEPVIKKYVIDCLDANRLYFSEMETYGLSKHGHEVGLLCDKGGLYLGECMVARILGDEETIKNVCGMYARNWTVCKQIGFLRKGSDELFVGRAGYLYGLVLMKKYFQIEPLPESDVFQILDSMIESGTNYSLATRSPCPLMYEYHGTEYLGAAHGLSGILQTILCFPDYLADNLNDADRLVRSSVDFLLSTQKSNGNFPSSMHGFEKGETKDLIHWCHGCGGIIFLLIKAYIVWSDKKYLKASILCGDLIWERGLLKKGPGICHGIAGSGYAHLLLYRVTKENKYLYRAYKFAEFMQTREFKEEAACPDRPFSLFEGVAGTACFLADLLEPEKADHPIFPIFTDISFFH